MDLVYSEESLELTSAFKSYRNSVNIYTEDKDDDRQFYVRLFSRLLEGTGCYINDVTPLGNCISVKQASENNPDPKGIYIIDGTYIQSFRQNNQHLRYMCLMPIV